MPEMSYPKRFFFHSWKKPTLIFLYGNFFQAWTKSTLLRRVIFSENNRPFAWTFKCAFSQFPPIMYVNIVFHFFEVSTRNRLQITKRKRLEANKRSAWDTERRSRLFSTLSTFFTVSKEMFVKWVLTKS